MVSQSYLTSSSSTIPKEMQTVQKIVLNGLHSPLSKRVYRMAIQNFLVYWVEQGMPIPDKLFLQTYIFEKQDQGLSSSSLNLRLSAIKNFAREAADLNIWPYEVPTVFSRVKKIPTRGTRNGNWLTLEQAQKLIDAPNVKTLKGKRDRAILSILLGCGLRRAELASLTLNHLQQRHHVWVLANILGKRNKLRTVVIPDWAMRALNVYIQAAKISNGHIFRPVVKSDKIHGEVITTKTLYRVVKIYATKCGFPEVAPHDLRRTYAKLAYKNGAKLDQIQINLGHESLTTTQKYLGIELDLEDGPGSYLDIKIE